MGCFSITFVGLSYQLSSFFGPVGFILANCTNMLLRIIFSIIYIRKQYRTVNLKPLDGIIPNTLFVITLIVLGIVCKVSEVIRSFHYFLFIQMCELLKLNTYLERKLYYVSDSFVPAFNTGTYRNWCY